MEILKFVYTGNAAFEGMDLGQVVLLVSACTKFQGLERLSWLAETHIKNSLSTTNVFAVLKSCEAFHLASLKDYCLKFSVGHFDTMLANKEAAKEIGLELYQEFVSAKQMHKEPGMPVLPRTPGANEIAL